MRRLSFHAVRCCAAGLMLVLCLGVLHPARASEAEEGDSGRLAPLDLYQRFVSSADGQRCPMVPSCSHYARQAFERTGVLRGWIMTCDRLLRCGRDEMRSAERREGGAYDPLAANIFWWDKKAK